MRAVATRLAGAAGDVLTAARLLPQLAAAAVAQLVLLGALTAWPGLGLPGQLAGVGYGIGLLVLLGGAARRAGVNALGPADLVTLTRAGLTGGVTALVADGLASAAGPAGAVLAGAGLGSGPGGETASTAALVALATVALILDGVDGRVARRTGTESALGARFDMEVDAFLILVLSVHVALLLGPWVLAIGLMRYAYVAAGWALRWLRAPLPPRHSAKVVAAVQGIVLVVAASGVLPLLVEWSSCAASASEWSGCAANSDTVTVVVAAVALALLCWSFGHDVRLLWRARRAPSAEPAGRSGGAAPGTAGRGRAGDPGTA